MKFNWILSPKSDATINRYCIELEYKLRPKITKLLLARFEDDILEDFSDLYFDVDVARSNIRISDKTPPHLAKKISFDLDKAINDVKFPFK